MSTDAPELFAADPARGVVTLRLHKGLYPLEVVFGAAYVLIDRAYVLLDKDADGNVLVHARAKTGKYDDKDVEKLAGDFANEALSQILRARIAKEHKGRMETIVAQAIAGGLGVAAADDLGLDAIKDEDEDLDFLDDPLGIAVPWEERYRKTAREDRPETAGDEAEAGPGDSGGFRPVKPEGPER